MDWWCVVKFIRVLSEGCWPVSFSMEVSYPGHNSRTIGETRLLLSFGRHVNGKSRPVPDNQGRLWSPVVRLLRRCCCFWCKSSITKSWLCDTKLKLYRLIPVWMYLATPHILFVNQWRCVAFSWIFDNAYSWNGYMTPLVKKFVGSVAMNFAWCHLTFLSLPTEISMFEQSKSTSAVLNGLTDY